MKSFSKIFSYISKQWPRALSYLLFNILSVIFSVISFSMAIPFLKFLFDPEYDSLPSSPPSLSLNIDDMLNYFRYHLAQITEEKGMMAGLVYISIWLLVSTILKNLFIFLASYQLVPLRNTILRDLRKDLYHSTLYLPLSYFSRERKGDILSRFSVDITEVEHALVSGSQLIFKQPLYILTYLGVMFYISYQLTIFIILVLPLVGLIIGRISKRLRSQTAENQTEIGQQMSILEETLSGLRIIKSYNIEGLQEDKYAQHNNAIFQLSNRINRRRDLASPLSETMGVMVMVIIILYGGYLIIGGKGALSAEGFIGIIIMFSQLIGPLTSLSGFFYSVHKGRASLERLEAILDAPQQKDDAQDAQAIPHLENEITLDNVSFSYGDFQVLDDISLSIKKGETIALVGESGSGKSTLVNLLSRFQEIQDGSIKIDGVDIRDFKLNKLRSQIGIVSQDPVLFNDTIYNNINIQQIPDIEDQVYEAAKIAYADDFIMQKSEGYQTNVGDGGNNLSGGEKQRVTIARAVLKNAPILILDEATSALDTVSESLVQKALENLKKDRTTIVIAHRLSTVQHADRIYVMQKGKILESGTHEELMSAGKKYAQLVEMQELK